MYACTFVKYLWKDDDKKRRFKTLEKKVNLPFVPDISHEVAEGGWYSGTIERIVWNNNEEFFSIKVMDITPKKGISAELLLDVALKQGWLEREEME
jgi:hypothetical protein